MRSNMDEMLQRVRDYVFQTDLALKESQRVRDGSVQLETTALKEIRDDIWALEDKVRAAKWAANPDDQADLAAQIEPLMIQVMTKCQQHKDLVKGCQGLLDDIVGWCEKGTSAYRFAVHESAVSKAPSRYSSGGGAEGKAASASRIPQYKSPTKQPKVQQQPAPQQQQQQQPAQQQQLLQASKHSRIPQPLAGTRKSLPDTDQQGTSPDQLAVQGDANRSRGSSSSGGAVTDSASSASEGGKAVGVAASRIAAFQRNAAASSSAPSGGAAPPAAVRGGSGGLVAAAAAAFGGARAAAPAPVARTSSSGGSAPASSAAAAGAATAAAVAAPAAAADAAPSAAPLEAFVPLDLDAEDDDDEDDCQLVQQQQQPAQQPKVEQQQAQQQRQEARAQGLLSHSIGSSNGSGSLAAARGSGGRVASRSLLQLEPSRDDVPLSSATQLMQQPAPAAPAADATAPAAAPASTAAAATGHPAVPPLRLSDSQSRSLQQLKVPRPSYTSDASAADAGSSANEFPEFGPLRSFTPMVSQHMGRSHPFAVAGAGGGGSSNGYVDRGSMRTSQDISMLLRSGMLVEAALLSSNASRMHVIHDAVAKKPAKPEGEPEVPVVPSRLAVHKRRPWWAQAARVVVGTAAMAVAGAAGAATAKHLQTGEGEGAVLPGMLRPRSGGAKGSRGGKQQQQQSLALEEASSQLPFVPMGPAPDASAGCG